MKDSKLVEYGQIIDSDAMVHPPDTDQLELEPDHPGLNDPEYVARRRYQFDVVRKHRLEKLGPPLMDYTPWETKLWQEVTPELDELHQKHASEIYLRAKRDLAITSEVIPQLRHLSDRLQRETNMHLTPAEGALPYRTFYESIAGRGFPVTQFLRHPSHPEFTPEPDMIHDCLGHVPPLMNQDYAELLTLIGKSASATPHGDQVLALKRFSWFSIEFGLIEEQGEVKVFGSGILSSTSEIPHSLFSSSARRRPFVTEDVIKQDYDPSHMQVDFFIAPSFKFLRLELEGLVSRFGIPVI